MEFIQSSKRVLIVEEGKEVESAYVRKNRIMICLGIILNMFLFQIIVFMFYDTTKHLPNLEDSSPGLPLIYDAILIVSLILNCIYSIFISHKVWNINLELENIVFAVDEN
tara:strand:+ start:1134 stop:1463 length:330 start_codon:yes stop_codon:yes gene_type:complete